MVSISSGEDYRRNCVPPLWNLKRSQESKATLMNRSFNELLHAHQPIIGTLLTLASPEVAEALALLGFDWVFIDLEHGRLSVQDAQRALQAISRRSFTLVRVPDGTAENIKRVLDTGCDGIIVPLLTSSLPEGRGFLPSRLSRGGGGSCC